MSGEAVCGRCGSVIVGEECTSCNVKASPCTKCGALTTSGICAECAKDEHDARNAAQVQELQGAPKPGGATLTASGTQTVLMLAHGTLFVNGVALSDAENVALKLEGSHATVCFKLRVSA